MRVSSKSTKDRISTIISKKKCSFNSDLSNTSSSFNFDETIPIRKIGHRSHVNNKDHDFELIDEIGSGGMGIIFTAHQRSIDRQIAIKVINPQLSQDSFGQDAFLKEAIITGNLDHPNILAVHDLGQCQDGNLFYAMKKIEGTSWDRAINKKSELENLEILLKVCDAIAYAHSKGIIHRDLKPANVMLGNFGEVLVMDWGLAAGIGDRLELSHKASKITDESDIVGTPAYMAPEMLASDSSQISTKSDIYLLGGILFEIITQLKPHSKSTIHPLFNVRHNIIQKTSAQGELINIALQAMQTDQRDRYQTVKHFQKAIKNYLKHRESIHLTDQADSDFYEAEFSGSYQKYGEALFGYREAIKLWESNHCARTALNKTIQAYASCAREKGDYDLAISLLDNSNPDHRQQVKDIEKCINKRDKKNKLIKLLSISFTALLVIIISILSISYVLIHRERSRALSAKNAAEMSELKANLLLKKCMRENYYNSISLATSKIIQTEINQANRFLHKSPEEFQGWEWHLLKNIASPLKTQLKIHNDSINTVLLTKSGRIITGSTDTTIKITDLNTGKVTKTLFNKHQVSSMATAEDTSLLYTNGANSSIHIWDIETGALKHKLNGHKAAISSLILHPQKPVLISSAYDSSIKFWDVKTYKLLKTLTTPSTKNITTMTISPNGKYLACGFNDGSTEIRSYPSGATINKLSMHKDYINTLAFNHQSSQLAIGDGAGILSLWDVETGKNQFNTHLADYAINSLNYSKENHLLCSYGRKAILAQIDDWRIVKTFQLKSKGNIYCSTITADSKLVITGDSENILSFWDGESRFNGFQQSTPVAKPPGYSFKINKNTISAFNTKTKKTTIIKAHSASINKYAFYSSKLLLLTCSDDTTAKLWQLPEGKLLTTYKGHTKYVSSCAFSPNGKYIATGSWDNSAKIWETRTGKLLHTLKSHSQPVTSINISPDSKKLITGSYDCLAILWQITNNIISKKVLRGHTQQLNDAFFCSDNKRIISLSNDKTIKVWDTEKAKELLSIPLTALPISGSFGDAGQKLTIQCNNNTYYQWSTRVPSKTPKANKKHQALPSLVLYKSTD